MDAESYSLNDLAEATGFEARTIRSYIERGLLPSAEARGRGASYSVEHLNRLRAIQILRRARPNIQLNEIRLFLQQMSPQQIADFCSGSLRATATALADTIDETEEPEALRAIGQFLQPQVDEIAEGAESSPPDNINEYKQVIVRVGETGKYYLAGVYPTPLKFEFEGKTISGEPVNFEGQRLQPGDTWVGPHAGIPYVLAAAGDDI